MDGSSGVEGAQFDGRSVKREVDKDGKVTKIQFPAPSKDTKAV